MKTCDRCGAPLQQLFMSLACSQECDLTLNQIQSPEHHDLKWAKEALAMGHYVQITSHPDGPEAASIGRTFRVNTATMVECRDRGDTNWRPLCRFEDWMQPINNLYLPVFSKLGWSLAVHASRLNLRTP